MHATAQRRPTFDELYEAIRALPEGLTGEIVRDNSIEVMSRPGRSHRNATRRFGPLLDTLERDTAARWVFEIEAEIRFVNDRLLVPDLSGWRVGEDGTDFLDENPILRRPDWVCEILSESTHRKDRVDKLPIYAAAGVAHVWVVDPDRHSAEVWVPRDGVPVALASAEGNEVVRLPPFDLEIDLATLWLPPRR